MGANREGRIEIEGHALCGVRAVVVDDVQVEEGHVAVRLLEGRGAYEEGDVVTVARYEFRHGQKKS